MLQRKNGIIISGNFIDTEIRPTHCRHYSDNNKIIIQVETNNEYSDAIDILPCKYTYIEGDKDIEEKVEVK